jgi:translation initiation factor IF-2
MSKQRVYEVARDLGVDQADLVKRVAVLGIQVRNHMSALEPADVERVKRAYEKDKADKKVETVRAGVVRRRAVPPPPEPVAPPEPVVLARPEPEVRAPSRAERTDRSDERAQERPESRTQDRARQEARPEQRPETRVERPSDPQTAAQVEARPSEPRASEARSAAEPRRPEGESRAEAPRAEARKDERPAQESTGEPKEQAESREAPRKDTPEAPPADYREGVRPVRSQVGPRTEVVMSGPSEGAEGDQRPSQAPVGRRLQQSYLPLGVTRRGDDVAPSAQPLSEAARNRIIQEHQSLRPSAAPPRRQEIRASTLGPNSRIPLGAKTKRKPLPGKKGLKTEITVPSAQKRIIRIEENIALQGLAQKMSLKSTDVLMKLMQMGMGGVNINSTLDSDTAKLLASEFGYEVENVAKTDDELIKEAVGSQEGKGKLLHRAPIVTVMGHVDHGKTSLLDRIRKANVAGGEAGGITQHIGAYRVETSKGPIVFLDTPGHEAFTAMRARGAQATDVVVLVVAADDGVMPQTREAVNHAKAADVSIIVAVNKIDKPGARPDQIRQELSGLGLQPEEWGGDTLFVNVSALTGENVDVLLESISLQTEMLELTANPDSAAEGVVLEAYLDKGRGVVANILVQGGTLNQGDLMIAGIGMGRIKALTDDRGRRLKEAGPSTPVEVLGLSDLPFAGDPFHVVADQRKAQELVDQRKKQQAARANVAGLTGMERFNEMMRAGETQELNLVIKGDMQGSVEALVKALTSLSTDKVKVKVIHTGVGGITENDVMLATASKAIIVGFNVRPAGKSGETAKAEGIEIRGYSIIYEAVDDVKKAMAGLLAPVLKQKELGKAEVRAVFTIPKIGAIAGCYVTEGLIKRNSKARLMRDSALVWEGGIGSLRRVKDDVREVTLGFECGIALDGYNDIHEHDIIECYEMEEVAATL